MMKLIDTFEQIPNYSYSYCGSDSDWKSNPYGMVMASDPNVYYEYLQANKHPLLYNGAENYGINGEDPKLPVCAPTLNNGYSRSGKLNDKNMSSYYMNLFFPSGCSSTMKYTQNLMSRCNRSKNLPAIIDLPKKSGYSEVRRSDLKTVPNNKELLQHLYKYLWKRSKSNKNQTLASKPVQYILKNNGRNQKDNITLLKEDLFKLIKRKKHLTIPKMKNQTFENIFLNSLGENNIKLPEKLKEKKLAQLKALQNLSKLKAMIHMAKEERRAVQHKREEARREFLTQVAEELQLMSSAKLAELKAIKSYRSLAVAEKALTEKDRDIHSLLEKEDLLYEDLTDAEASLAKADMNFIPKIQTETDLKKFASFLNFGF